MGTLHEPWEPAITNKETLAEHPIGSLSSSCSLFPMGKCGSDEYSWRRLWFHECVVRSTDNGMTWSELRLLPASPAAMARSPMAQSSWELYTHVSNNEWSDLFFMQHWFPRSTSQVATITGKEVRHFSRALLVPNSLQGELVSAPMFQLMKGKLGEKLPGNIDAARLLPSERVLFASSMEETGPWPFN